MLAMLASPLAKIVGATLGALALFGVGFWYGDDLCQTRQRASIMEQAMDAAENMRKANHNSARVERELTVTRARLADKDTEYEQIKERYANSQEETFRIGRELERAVDEFSRVHNTGPHRVPAAAESAGLSPQLPEATLTSVALLSAYGHCAQELDRLYDAYYAPLVDFEQTARVIAAEGAGFFTQEDTR